MLFILLNRSTKFALQGGIVDAIWQYTEDSLPAFCKLCINLHGGSTLLAKCWMGLEVLDGLREQMFRVSYLIANVIDIKLPRLGLLVSWEQ